MVKIDERLAALLQSQKEGWPVPQQHPDMLPPHEALQLRELFRELQRTNDVKARPADFKQWIRGAEDGAAALETAPRVDDPTGADTAMRQTAAKCASCHARYRNVSQAR
jgi:hypothetical protein